MLEVDFDSETWAVRKYHATVFGERLTKDDGSQHWPDFLARWMHHEELSERAVLCRHSKVIAVDRESMRNDRHSKLVRKCRNFLALAYTTCPAHIWLDHIYTGSQEGLEPPSRCLVLARGDQDSVWGKVSKSTMPIKIVRNERLLEPVKPKFLTRRGQRCCALHLERHPTVPHQREPIAYSRPHFCELFDVLLFTISTVSMAKPQGHFCRQETELLG